MASKVPDIFSILIIVFEKWKYHQCVNVVVFFSQMPDVQFEAWS